MSHRHTFEDIAASFPAKASRYIAERYRSFGVERDDVQQECFVWLYGDGKRRVERWLESAPQQTTRIYLSILEEARLYAEREKAYRAGYSYVDVWWYTPNMIESLIPLVLDDTYTRPSGEVDDLLSSVLDVRRVMDDEMYSFFIKYENDHPLWLEKVHEVINLLGGERPRRRHVMSNAQSQAITGENYGG